MFRGAVLAAVLACTIYGFVSYLIFLDAFKSSFQHYPGLCKQVKGARYGSEDMEWTIDGLVFITTGVPIPDVEKYFLSTGTHGEIQLFDFKDPSAGVVDLKVKPSKEFDVLNMRPHGITIQEDRVKGEHILYVINHPAKEEREVVEKFKFDPTTRHLTHLRSIELDNFNFFNNIAALAEDQFYISKYTYMPSKSVVFHALNNLIPMRLGKLYFYNGTGAAPVTPSLVTPNGVALSKDQRYVYAVTTLEQSLHVYKRDSSTNHLSLVQKVFLGAKGDNLILTPKGDALLLATHPVFYKLLLHLLWALSPDWKSPSAVLRIPLGKDGLVRESDITELFYDHGDLISGSSAAVAFHGQLLIGSVANSLVHCQLNMEL